MGSEKEINKKRRNCKLITLVLLIIVVILSSFYFIYINNSLNLYRNVFKMTLNNVFDLYEENNSKLSYNIKANFDIVDNNDKVVDLLNQTDFEFGFNGDINKNKFQINLKADNLESNLLNSKMLLDFESQNIYFYDNNFFDKYFEIPIENKNLEEYESSKSNAFSGDINVIKDTLYDEIDTIILKEDCNKKDGKHFYSISYSELSNRIIKSIERLKNNSKFLNQFNDKESVYDYLDYLQYDIENEFYNTDDKFEIIIEKNIFSRNISYLSMTDSYNKIDFDIAKDKIIFNLYDLNGDFYKFTIDYKINKNSYKLVISSLEENGVSKVTLNIIDNKNKLLFDEIDKSKVVSMDKITLEDYEVIMNNLGKSKLFEIINDMDLNFNN